MKTRTATGDGAQDAELVARTRELDRLKSVQDAARTEADAASDDTNHLEARAQGKLTFLSLRAADVLAEDLTATLYINGVSAGAITLLAGQLYSYLTFDSGTIVPLQSILFVRFETDAEEANVTCTVRVGEYV